MIKPFTVLSLLLTLGTMMIHAQMLPADGKLTVDPKLQTLAQRLLANKQGSITAIEPETGRILCMVSNELRKENINRAIGIDYSPGSTFKVAQALAMLSEGEINEETEHKCYEGFWQDNIHIGCHKHASPLKLIDGIAQSCNSWFCKAFRKYINNREKYPTKLVAIQTWYDYMTSMGLGPKLGIDMPGEADGVIPDTAFLEKAYNGRWNGTTIMWVGMGQGEVKVTPLQICNLAAVIANRGWYITPHIHEAATADPLDTTYTAKHFAKPTAEAFDTVIKGMRQAAINGTCASINTPMFDICGKTGTAENDGADHSIFIGFAPMENPKIAVSIYIENGGFGADLAAPLGAIMMEQHIKGELTPRSENHVRQWEKFKVKLSPKEVPMTLDDF